MQTAILIKKGENVVIEKNSINKLKEIDYLGSAEFDITEGIKDLVWNIKSIKKDVDKIKKHLNLIN